MNASTTQDAIEVKNAPDIPGLAFRHFGGDTDFPLMADLVNLCYKADQIEEVTTVDELSNSYRNLNNCDLDKDMLVAEVDGQMVSYTRVWWVEEPGQGTACHHIAYLHPDWRRQGLGTAMLAWNQSRLREKMAKDNPEGPLFFRAAFNEHQLGDKALLEGSGYQAERYFFEMKRDLSQPIPEPALPDGLEIRPVDEAHYRPIWEAMYEAFKDHWGYSPGTEKDYKRWLGNPNFDPELWKVAWDGDQVAGMILNVVYEEENRKLDRKWGWTDPICTRRPWRRRGLASALLLESMRELKARGMQCAVLSVDVNHPHGALKLYEDAGFKTFARFETWRKPLN